MQNRDWQTRCAHALASIDRKAFILSDGQRRVAGRGIPPLKTVEQILQACRIGPGARVLHLGSGSGYLTAILAVLAKEVIAVERLQSLAEFSRTALAAQGLHNVTVRCADAASGAADMAPFDLIVVSTPKIKTREPLWDQLTLRGEFLCVEIGEASRQLLVKYINRGNKRIARSEHGYIEFVPAGDDIYVELGFVSPEMLNEARARAGRNRTLVVDEIARLQNIDAQKLYRALSDQYGLPLLSANEVMAQIDPTLHGNLSRAYLSHEHIIPIHADKSSVTVACRDPNAPMDEVQQLFPGLKINRVLVTPVDYRRIWGALERGEKGVRKADDKAPGKAADLLTSEAPHSDARLVNLYEALLLDAVADRASDIHLERYGANIRVRLRVDGELRDLDHYYITPAEYTGLINVVKLRSELNIAERRLPQGGRSQARVGNTHYDLRVQVQPSLHGEHVVIRLLPQNSSLISIEQLGMQEHIANAYRRLLRNPAGLVLVVGPTGSGKTTTLNAGLQLLAEDTTRKVITVEDPIEYSIDNIQQTRVRPDIGFSFADAMRSFVRQDPDVILVGEIRDHETAQEAIRASQTGHVVLSTLHCNDAVDAVQRLFDLNVHPNSLASELLAVIAQRLAKRVCEHCKVEDEPDPDILKELFPKAAPKGFRCFRGKGCPQCNGTGTKGRVGVIEFLQFNGELRNAVSRRTPVGELRALALDSGLYTMRDSALDHVIQGNIPLSELPRILPQERMAPEKRGQWKG
ncbi:MAG: protein-L-isoaspartate(D-aspartate) O-methyltransferase [Pseudomonadales bacterium]|nr:protein-L-isoaspartate(D-aspartate) O-methyltransferase [Pseudomonadales bacterium]